MNYAGSPVLEGSDVVPADLYLFPYLVCFTWKVCPAIVIVPLRFFGFPVYAATE